MAGCYKFLISCSEIESIHSGTDVAVMIQRCKHEDLLQNIFFFEEFRNIKIRITILSRSKSKSFELVSMKDKNTNSLVVNLEECLNNCKDMCRFTIFNTEG